MGMDLPEALAKAQQIADLEERAIKANQWENMDQFVKALLEIGQLRSELKLFLVDNSVVSLPQTVERKVYSVLEDLALDEMRPVDKLVEGTPLEVFLHKDIEELGEPQELAIDSFYTWTSGGDYVSILYDFPSLVLPEGRIADKVRGAVSEARVSYVFYNNLAVCSLSRTILDIVLRDIYLSEGFIPSESSNIRPYFPSLTRMTKDLCRIDKYRGLKEALYGIISHANKVIHGEKWADHEAAYELFRSTLCIVRDLCAQNEKGRHDRA